MAGQKHANTNKGCECPSKLVHDAARGCDTCARTAREQNHHHHAQRHLLCMAIQCYCTACVLLGADNEGSVLEGGLCVMVH